MRAGRAARTGPALLASALLVLTVSGCSAADSPAPADDPEATSALAPRVVDQDFPDPDVMEADGTYHAYATNGPGQNIRHATSTDLVDWTVDTLDDPLPDLPAWATAGKTWAPDVSDFGDGRYVMYFTAASTDPVAQCIGVAVASDPAGPFVPQGDAPLVCPEDEGGAIDPATFVDDDGARYLLFKNDGNCCGLDTWLQLAPLAADGLSLAGPVTKLLKQDQAWEGSLIEAPTLVKRGGQYVLFYSANDYGGDRYAVGYATAAAAAGPYTKADGPFLSTDTSEGRYLGPGGQDVVVAPDGSDALVFHTWDELYIARGVATAPLTWDGATPTLG
jgi:beta-xylosidase